MDRPHRLASFKGWFPISDSHDPMEPAQTRMPAQPNRGACPVPGLSRRFCKSGRDAFLRHPAHVNVPISGAPQLSVFSERPNQANGSATAQRAAIAKNEAPPYQAYKLPDNKVSAAVTIAVAKA